VDAIIVYWSKTGNTEKVALAIQEGLKDAGADVSLKRVEDAGDVDFYAHDLVCIGFPSYRWSPPQPMDEFLNSKFRAYRDQGRVKVGAPKVPGKNALIFCTYSGPHTGIRETIPAGLYAGQFFEHLGFTVLDEWYLVGEFHGSEEDSTKGRLGDIRGRPNQEDLRKVKQDASQLAREADTVFVATSKRFYEEAMQIVRHLKHCGVTVHHPCFHLDSNAVDTDPELKSQVTQQHFLEINESEMVYALLPRGYIGCSVTIELTYAYAKGKRIVVSEAPSEFAVWPMVSEICSPEQFLARFERK